MVCFTFKDVVEAVDGFMELSNAFDRDRAVAAARFVGGTLRPLLAFIEEHKDRISFTSYTVDKYVCVGFCVGEVTMKSFLSHTGQLLNSRSALIHLVNKDRKPPLERAQMTRVSLRKVTTKITLIHICPKAPKSAPAGEAGGPICWEQKVEGAVAPWPHVLSALCFMEAVASGAVSVPLPDAVVVEGQKASAVPHLSPEVLAAHAASSAAESDSDVTADSFVASDGGVDQTALEDLPESSAISLVDVAATSGATSITVSSRLPAELPLNELPKDMRVYQPKYSQFVPVVLHSLYTDPVGVTSVAWRDRLKELGFSVHDFEQLRAQLFFEKSPPPLVHPVEKDRPRGFAVSYRVFSIRHAIEAALIRQAMRGNVDEPIIEGSNTLTVFVYGDAAGRAINSLRVWLLAAIPACLKSMSSLSSVVPLAAHFGDFREIHRKVFHHWIEADLRSVTHINYRGAEKKLRFVSISDLADAWSAYEKDDVAAGRSVSFLTTATRGHTYMTHRPCPMCHATMMEICALKQRELPERPVFPRLRGIDMRMPYINPRLHALINGLPKWLADAAIVLMRAGDKRRARWVCAAFSQAGGFVPHEDIFSCEKLPDGEALVTGGHPGHYGTKPRASVRGKDIKAFLRDSAPSNLPSDWSTQEVPPVGFRLNPSGVRELLDGSVRETETRTRTLKALWDDVLLFFRAFSPPDPACLGTPRSVKAHRALGEDCFYWYKLMLAQCRPWTSEELRKSPPKWFEKLDAKSQKVVLDACNDSATRIDYPDACIGVGVHCAFEHMCDIFDLLPWTQASRVVEEAFDHVFSYLYYTVPAVANRSLQTTNNAATVWKVLLEATTAGFPSQSKAAEARLLNSAYL